MNKMAIRGTIAAAVTGCALGGQALADSMSWQERRLFTPTEGQLMAERRGQVMIYDQLDADVVDKALDSNFQRVQNMMFIRVKHRAQDGTVVQDDDC
jgi:hypothetical protein